MYSLQVSYSGNGESASATPVALPPGSSLLEPAKELRQVTTDTACGADPKAL